MILRISHLTEKLLARVSVFNSPHRILAPSTRLSFLPPTSRHDHVAIHDEFGAATYGDLARKSSAVATALKRVIGEDRQQTISFLCGNNRSFAYTLFGIWQSGNIAVPLCKSHPPPSLGYYVSDSQSKLVVTTEDYLSKMEPALRETGAEFLLLDDLISDDESADMANESEKFNTDMDGDSSALIIYTSGTTGAPKGVVCSHRNVGAQVKTMLLPWRWTSDDRILHVLPLHHVHGLVNCLLCPLAAGATIHMLPNFDAKMVWEILLTNDSSIAPSVFMAVPSIYSKLISDFKSSNQTTSIQTRNALSRLRLMVSGSAALPRSVADEWQEISGHALLERYGMTEIGMALGNPYEASGRLLGFVGRPFPGVNVRVVDTSSKETLVMGSSEGSDILGVQEDVITGDLQISGATVFQKYYNRPEATQKEFTDDGWFQTGDTVAYHAAKDSYQIVGRTSVDVIKSGGYKIGALEIERHLLGHPSITDVAVVGVDDDVWGQRVAAIVTLQPSDADMSLADLREWAVERMPHYQVPSLLAILPELPRNVMGKVNKKELARDTFPSSTKS